VVLLAHSYDVSFGEGFSMKAFAMKGVVAAAALAASVTGWGAPATIQHSCTDDYGNWDVDVCIGAVPTIETALEGDGTDPGLIAQYSSFNDLTIGIVYKPSGTLVSDISTSLGATPPQDSPYDLFLAADTAGPNGLYTNYQEDIGQPLNYAEGTIMLWSNGDQYSINANLSPAAFAAAYTTTGICNPNMGPYGVVAQTVLEKVYGIDPDPSTNPKIKTYPMITNVDTAISAGGGMTNGVQSGWVPTALHCQGGSVVFDNPNVTYQVFTPTQGQYSSAFQAGTAIDSSRGKQTVAQGFLNWLATATGQTALQYYCLEKN
jgi:ABC-type molybdate transport system substrate-binding protein